MDLGFYADVVPAPSTDTPAAHTESESKTWEGKQNIHGHANSRVEEKRYENLCHETQNPTHLLPSNTRRETCTEYGTLTAKNPLLGRQNSHSTGGRELERQRDVPDDPEN